VLPLFPPPLFLALAQYDPLNMTMKPEPLSLLSPPSLFFVHLRGAIVFRLKEINEDIERAAFPPLPLFSFSPRSSQASPMEKTTGSGVFLPYPLLILRISNSVEKARWRLSSSPPPSPLPFFSASQLS